jgi:hypothetical protein
MLVLKYGFKDVHEACDVRLPSKNTILNVVLVELVY